MPIPKRWLLCVPLLSAPLTGQEPRVFQVDGRLEMFQLVSDLIASPGESCARDLALFASLRSHPALVIARSIPSKLRDSDLFPLWALCFTDPPALAPMSEVPSKVRELVPAAKEVVFLEALRDFSKRALPILALDHSWKQGQESLVEFFNAGLAPALEAIDRLGGFGRDGLVSGAFMEGVPSGGFLILKPDPRRPQKVFLIFTFETDPIKRMEMGAWAVPAALKATAEAILENAVIPPVPEEPGRRWLPSLQQVNRLDSPSWEAHVKKSLAWALRIRVEEALGEAQGAEGDLKRASARMPWVPRLVSRWKELDQVPGHPVPMAKILPELIQVFQDEDPVILTKIRMVGVRPVTTPRAR